MAIIPDKRMYNKMDHNFNNNQDNQDNQDNNNSSNSLQLVEEMYF